MPQRGAFPKGIPQHKQVMANMFNEKTGLVLDAKTLMANREVMSSSFCTH